MTEKEFLKEMEWFLEYYDTKIKGIKAKVWFEIFSKEDQPTFHKALKKHIETDETTFMPAPGKIKKIIIELKYNGKIPGLNHWIFS